MEVIIYAIVILFVILVLLLRVWKDRMNEPKSNDLNDADRYNDTDLLQEQINNDQQIFMQ